MDEVAVGGPGAGGGAGSGWLMAGASRAKREETNGGQVLDEHAPVLAVLARRSSAGRSQPVLAVQHGAKTIFRQLRAGKERQGQAEKHAIKGGAIPQSRAQPKA